MKKHFISEILFVLWCTAVPVSYSLSQEVFRPQPNISGTWSSEIWQKLVGSNWINTTDNPAQGQHIVYITTGSEIALDRNASARYLQIEEGATLIYPGDYNLNINDLAIDSAYNLDIFGKLILTGSRPFLQGNARGIVRNTGYVQVDGSKKHDDSSDIFAVQNNVEWETGAIFDWNTETPFQMRKGIQGINYFYFPNNATNGKVAIFRISKDVIIENTGNNGIHGLLEVNAEVVIGKDVTTSFNKTFTYGICGSGRLIAGGTGIRFEIDGEDAILGGRNLIVESYRKISLKNDISIPTDSSVILLGEGIDNNQAGQILAIHGILDMTDRQITNTSGTVRVTGTGLFRTERTGGFTGSNASIPSGEILLDDDSTIEFYGGADAPQTINNRSDYKNIIVSGNGTKRPSGPFASKGTISIRDHAILDGTTTNIGDENTHLTMTGGRLILGTTGTQPQIKGNYNLSGGVIEFANNHTGIGSEQTIRGGDDYAYQNIEVTGVNVKNSNGNIRLHPNGTFVVSGSGIFTSSSGNASIIGINGSGQRVTVASGGMFKTEVEPGLYGKKGGFGMPSPSIQNSIESVILEPGSTIEYAMNGAQNISADDIFTYHHLTLSGNGEKRIPPDMEMHIKGDFIATDAALFEAANSTVIFSGSNDQTIASDGHDITFYNLIIDNAAGVSIGQNNRTKDIAVLSTLDLKEHARLLFGEADMVIKSTINNTARIHQITESAVIAYPGTGRFRIERYINDHIKAWQLLGVNTHGGTIFESWQNRKDNTPERGIRITSNTSLPGGSDGFDDYSPGGPSMKYYHIDHQEYKGISSTYDIISDHSGYLVFVRGDRNQIGVDTDIHSATTIHTRGQLYSAATPPPSLIVPAGKFAIMGNPYASAIDFSQLTFEDRATGATTGLHLSKGYYIWNPMISLPGRSLYYYGQGAFQRVQDVSGYPIVVPSPLGSDAIAAPIQSGQAVFVYNGSTNDESVTFSEAAKVTGSINDFFRPIGNVDWQMPPFIRTNLAAATSDGTFLLDGTMQIFGDEFSNEVDEYDARKINNEGENLWLTSDVYPLIVEYRAFPGDNDTTFFNIDQLKKTSYQLQIQINDPSQHADVIQLHDLFKSETIPLEEGNNYYDFEVTEDAASSASDRFYMTFVKKPLPIIFYFENENVHERNGQAVISWMSRNQNDITTYDVEYGSDGVTFTSIGRIEIEDHSKETYQFEHSPYPSETHYYRVKAIDFEGRSQYSKTMVLHIPVGNPSIRVYPTPARQALYVDFMNLPIGKYQLKIIDNAGKTIHTKEITYQGGKATFSMPIVALSSGVYHLSIAGQNGLRETKKIVVGQ